LCIQGTVVVPDLDEIAKGNCCAKKCASPTVSNV
jgi:hypothetical protein